MRILFMMDTQEGTDSGAAGTELQTAAALRALGHDVDMVWSPELGRRIAHGNLHYLLELPIAFRWRMLARMRGAMYEVVHVSQPHGWLAAWTAHRLDSPPVFVHRSHGLEPRLAEALAPWHGTAPSRATIRRWGTRALAGLLRLTDHAIARHADGHIVSNSLCARYLTERLAVPKNRVAVIAQAAPSAYLEKPLPLTAPQRVERLLYVGQFAFFKAPMILARAFEMVARANPRVTLTWVCSARHHDQARALLAESVRSRVRFLDWMSQEQLMATFDEHGVFLFPSFFEGFGKAFIEAMARGLLVVASREGGANDLIEDSRNGFLVPVGDAAAMAEACLRIQRLGDGVAAISNAARETALAHTWTQVATDTAAFYSQLIESRRS